MSSHMDKGMRNALILVTLIVVAVLAALWATETFWLPIPPWASHRPPMEGILLDLEFFYTVKTVFSTINVTLLVILLATYAGIYRKTRSEFTIGLMIFSVVLLLNALSSNPFIMWVFGFRAFGLGPFAMLPDLFTFGALTILLYFSIKY